SSRFLPLTRSLSPLTWLSTLSLASLIAAWIFFASSRSMPCFTAIFCRAPARLVSMSPNSRQRASIFRAVRRARRMSVICCNWNSLGADMAMLSSSRTNFASTPLKSKRVPSSRLAWSTALVSSWVSTSEPISKAGMSLPGRSGRVCPVGAAQVSACARSGARALVDAGRPFGMVDEGIAVALPGLDRVVAQAFGLVHGILLVPLQQHREQPHVGDRSIAAGAGHQRRVVGQAQVGFGGAGGAVGAALVAHVHVQHGA